MNKTRKILILIFLLAIGTKVNSQNERPNFLFILVDDLGWADIGVNGNIILQRN